MTKTTINKINTARKLAQKAWREGFNELADLYIQLATGLLEGDAMIYHDDFYKMMIEVDGYNRDDYNKVM